MTKKVVIAGGSGFIGHALVREFDKAGYVVVVLSRSGSPVKGAEVRQWDGETLGPWAEELERAEAVINLAGENIAQHWSKRTMQQILNSRVLSTRVIGQAISAASIPPKVWVNASAVGYYGDREGEELTESSAPGPKREFLVDVCVAWEHEVASTNTPQTRKTWMRTGLVIGRGGGVFEPLYMLTKWFLGGHVGNGSQYMPWIHMDDLAGMFRWAVENEAVAGPVNGTSPEPVNNRFFMATMRAVVGRPWAPPVPGFMLKIVAALGGPPASLLLEGQRALPGAAMEKGFEFKYKVLAHAIEDLIKRGRRSK